LAACQSSNTVQTGGDTQTDNKTETQEYKYGKVDLPVLDGSLCGAPAYIAYEQGFFAEEGFDVTLISSDFESRKIGLNNGTYPIVNGDFQFFPSIEQGVKVKVIDGYHNGCIKLVVRADSDINTAEDLKGKKIGIDEVGGTPHQVASLWVEQAGISALPEDGEVTFLPFTDGNLELAALYGGDIDVAALWDPFGSMAENDGKGRVILDIAHDSVFADRYCCFLFASEKVLESEPEKVAALLRAFRKAQDWIGKNPEESVDVIAKGNYAEIEDTELAVELIKSYAYPAEGEHGHASSHDVGDDVRHFAGALYNIGYLTTDPEEFTSNNYAEVDIYLGR
ncbi:MAG: ABC transporter substrate-binding protein, partial [Oscillospiraceae bacterium]|nr:ABC transporter substrate-binding protein [Oscillospiraceae bacterium]